MRHGGARTPRTAQLGKGRLVLVSGRGASKPVVTARLDAVPREVAPAPRAHARQCRAVVPDHLQRLPTATVPLLSELQTALQRIAPDRPGLARV
jgi:hypothetical protein